MIGYLFWLGITIIPFALLISRMADIGIRRLEGIEIKQLPVLFGFSLVGCLLGGLFGVLYLGNFHQPGIMEFILILFFGLLTVGAFVDYQTYWAPMELQIPTSICLGIVGWSCQQPTEGETLLLASLGLGLLGLTHCLWLVQAKLHLNFFPPMDIFAASAPIVLFGGTSRALIFYGLLAGLLTCIRFWPYSSWERRNSKVQKPGSIPFLAVVFPLMICFMLWEAFHAVSY